MPKPTNKKKKEVIKAPSLMPLPRVVKLRDGVLSMDSSFSVKLSGCVGPRLERATIRLVERLIKVTDISMVYDPDTTRENAKFNINVEEKTDEVQSATEEESYTLDVRTKGAVLNARTLYGALRGIETFIQLVQKVDFGFIVPEVHIADHPRFQWRGLLIDATRHWIPPNTIKRNLEAMSSVKLNVLHWHLTDDQGFRIESKQYPKLHELGSDGLYYTQEDVKDIVQFASDRGIRVIPEFDMPGHTSCWLIGYPELASAPGPYKIERNWGGFKAIMNPTIETTFEFIKFFLAEMATLFPDQYVHIGGDIMNDDHWQSNPEIQKFMTSKGIKDSHQLQAYFNQRLTAILRKLGKEVVGWDPIINSDLPSGIVIQSARGQKWLTEATSKGFQGIAGSEYYLDLLRPTSFYYEKDPFSGEAGELTTEQKELILGGEASMWTEFANKENIDSRIWPRTAAVAERLWSSREVTDVEDMYRRLSIMSQRFDTMGITHISYPKKMLQQLMGSDSINALSILGDILQPNFDIRWKNNNYTSLTPLNGLFDTTSPDSETARRFSKMVEKFIEAPSNLVYQDALNNQLKIWRGNHEELYRDIKQLQLLTELLPLSKTLMQIADIGLQSSAVLATEKAMKRGAWEKHERILSEASKIIVEFGILIVPDIRKLSRAIHIVQ